MGVTREIIKQGIGSERPKEGDEVIVIYTGNLYDSNAGLENHFRGKQCVHYTLHLAIDRLCKTRH